jgi:hypothetical protein
MLLKIAFGGTRFRASGCNISAEGAIYTSLGHRPRIPWQVKPQALKGRANYARNLVVHAFSPTDDHPSSFTLPTTSMTTRHRYHYGPRR